MNIISLILPVFPLIIYWWLVLCTSVNIPLWDDYDSVLNFLNEWIAASTGERFKLFFSQHNEHRISIIRFFFLIQHYLFEGINFRGLIIIANLFLTGFYLLLWRWVSLKFAKPDSTFIITAIGFVLFQPQFGDGMIWTTTTLSNFALVAIAFLTFRLAEQREARHTASAMVVSLIGIFSQANGILVPLCLIFIFALRKMWRSAGIWLLWSIVSLPLFFWGYNKLTYPPSIFDLPLNLELTIDYFFTFIGSSLGFSGHIPSLIAGGFLIFVAAITFFRRGLQEAFPISALLMFFVGSSILATIGRSPSGVIYALSPGRYTITSTVIITSLCVLSLLQFDNIKLRRYFIGILFSLCIIFNIASYRIYTKDVHFIPRKLLNELAQWTIGEPGLSYPWPDRSDSIMKASLASKTYKIPLNEYEVSLPGTFTTNLPPINKNLVFRIPRLSYGKGYIFISGKVSVKGHDSPPSDLKVLMKLNNDITVYKPRILKFPQPYQLKTSHEKRNLEFIALIPMPDDKLGQKLKFGISVHDGDNVSMNWIKKSLP